MRIQVVTLCLSIVNFVAQPELVAVNARSSGDYFETITAGGEHTCGIDKEGSAYCWGSGRLGQLGNGDTADRLLPTPVAGDLVFNSLTAGTAHTCGITEGGRAYCWGHGADGQLGSNEVPYPYTELVPTIVTGDLIFSSLTADGNHTCGITDDGRAYCWGSNLYGQLGNGDDNGRHEYVPTRIAGYRFKEFSSLTTGATHTCGIVPGGRAYCWGYGRWGRLGNGYAFESYAYYKLVPTPVVGGLFFGSLTVGAAHTCGVTEGGKAYCWGNGSAYQLGNFDVSNKGAPTLVLGDLVFSALAAGSSFTCGIAKGGKAYCWGIGLDGQLGNGDIRHRYRVVPSPVAGDLIFDSLTANDAHVCGIAKGGKAYCWGSGYRGRLGTGSATTQFVPARVGEKVE